MALTPVQARVAAKFGIGPGVSINTMRKVREQIIEAEDTMALTPVPLALTPVRGGGYRCDQHRRMPVLGEFLLRFRSCCVQAMPQPVDEQSRLDKC